MFSVKLRRRLWLWYVLFKDNNTLGLEVRDDCFRFIFFIVLILCSVIRLYIHWICPLLLEDRFLWIWLRRSCYSIWLADNLIPWLLLLPWSALDTRLTFNQGYLCCVESTKLFKWVFPWIILHQFKSCWSSLVLLGYYSLALSIGMGHLTLTYADDFCEWWLSGVFEDHLFLFLHLLEFCLLFLVAKLNAWLPTVSC